jgi:tRNA/rRNA methyltransferase
VTARQAAGELQALMGRGRACGILFGPERMGLLNDHLALADTVVSVPLNPAFSSLNLAQAVLILGYEWFTAGDATPAAALRTGDSEPATKEELQFFFEHLEEELDRNGFLRNLEKRPSMVRNLRNLFQRALCTEQELRTLHGVITAFAGPRDRK